MQYGQWTQDIEIKIKAPSMLPLIKKPTWTTNMPVTTYKPTSTIPMEKGKVTSIVTQITTMQTNIRNVTTMSIQENLHQDVAIVKFTGGQILLYLGQHHLLIQAKLLHRAYVKVKLWQQDE